MAARRLLRCVTVLLGMAAGWSGTVQGQYLYAGPGTVVLREVRGPFVYGVRPFGQPLFDPRFYYFYPGPYLEAPIIVPPGQVYTPDPYRRDYITPYGIPLRPNSLQPSGVYRAQPYGGYQSRAYGEYQNRPYGGYQPRLDRPRFTDPYAQPQWRGGQKTDAQANVDQPGASPTQCRAGVPATSGAAAGRSGDRGRMMEDPSGRTNTTEIDPNGSPKR